MVTHGLFLNGLSPPKSSARNCKWTNKGRKEGDMVKNPFKGTMINFSVSRPWRIDFQGLGENKTFLSLPFWVLWRSLPEFPPFVWKGRKSLMISHSLRPLFSPYKPFPKTSIRISHTDSKTNTKRWDHLMKMRNIIGLHVSMGIHVYFEGFVYFFARAHRFVHWTGMRNRENNYCALRGAWRDRDTNDIFADCFLVFYFLDFKFSNFVCPSELHLFIWFF